jgi:hypothetical protein
MKSIFSILNRAYIPRTNTIIERSSIKNADLLPFSSEYKDLKIISHLSKTENNNNNLDELLNKLDSRNSEKNTTKNIHNIVYNSIGYKNMGGIRLEVKGRLTKRYRADRSIYFVK